MLTHLKSTHKVDANLSVIVLDPVTDTSGPKPEKSRQRATETGGATHFRISATDIRRKAASALHIIVSVCK